MNHNKLFLHNVPVIPTEAMTGGLARDIFRGFDMGCLTGDKMLAHLDQSYAPEIPDWLATVLAGCRGHLDKGTRAYIIYTACIMVHHDEDKGHEAEMLQRLAL